ncbi:MAG: hypothetical protein K0Q49_162 [Haloplasmataceae bacterium]|jgi:putative ABC transport system permease protein|nr:hypothetical protein [Haloplasmataceae bacterium]
MMQLQNISKSYYIGNNEIPVLQGIDLTFESGEFVSILGPSGGGKTTLLNIIGGLDNYTDGDLIIKGKSTKQFKTNDWDAYRNNSVGFIFQNYNLIQHITILENVEMGMTLSGINSKERKKKAIQLLEQVGLKEHIYKKPNILSGGQKQRVAIARALANDPEIILADEPTGALDTVTSTQILDILNEISKDKLVIMVTHNPELASHYSTRIIRLTDGLVISDSKPTTSITREYHYKLVHTSMSFYTALKLSFNNLKTKISRTLITAFAGSIGIIGIALVLALGTGFSSNVNALETETLSTLPISITKIVANLNLGIVNQYIKKTEEFKEGFFNIYRPQNNQSHTNIITDNFIEYINNLNRDLYTSIEYRYGLKDTLYSKTANGIKKLSISALDWTQLPYNQKFIINNFDIVAGKMPESPNELTIIIDKNNQINVNTLNALAINTANDVSFQEVIGKELVFPTNKDFYIRSNHIYVENPNINQVYQNGQKLVISGVIRLNEESAINTNYGLYYKPILKETIINMNTTSEVCNKQKEVNYNVLTGDYFSYEATRTSLLQNLGCIHKPVSINIYPTSYNAKEQIKEYLDQYNINLPDEDKIIYNDLAETIGFTLGRIINMIQTILVAFAAISLVVSSIMIGIITYISVLERTKEIGILRSLGARKIDITSVFQAEAIIIGLMAGLFGISLTYILSFPLNSIINNFNYQLYNVVQLTLNHAIILIIISVILTFISGLLPSSIAARKNPVEALRQSE